MSVIFVFSPGKLNNKYFMILISNFNPKSAERIQQGSLPISAPNKLFFR
jgi:hypothetical protein